MFRVSQPGRARTGVMLATLIICSGLVSAVEAQFSMHLNLVSDFRFRGISLSARDAAAQGGVIFDHHTGLFAGIFASSVKFDREDSPHLRTVTYGGYARRITPDLSLEGGLGYYDYYGSEAIRWPYEEGFVGISFRRSNFRVHYAPDYFDLDVEQLYLEFNTLYPLIGKLSFGVHLGRIEQFGSPRARAYTDFELAVSYAEGAIIGEIAVVGSDLGGDCPAGKNYCDPGLALRVHVGF